MVSLPTDWLVVFLDEQTGLGHVRVTEALAKTLAPTVRVARVVHTDSFLIRVHGASSASLGKFIQEKLQYGIGQYLTTPLMRLLFRCTARRYMKAVLLVLTKNPEAEHIVFVATHFAPAHRVATFVEQLRKQHPNKTYHLIVQVTDDSPQYIWYVPGADMTFVPSEETQRSLQHMASKFRLPKHELRVLPYPLSSSLTKQLSKAACEERFLQLDPKQTVPLHICIPISGALAGLAFLHQFMQTLHRMHHNVVFHVVCRQTLAAKLFLSTLQDWEFVELTTAADARELVEAYEDVYEKEVIALEVTKPSEQAFKTMLPSSSRGGAILLFTEAVGRQEKDNLVYLRKRGLVPSGEEQYQLQNGSLPVSKTWRGYVLPTSPVRASSYVSTLLRLGELQRNITCQSVPLAVKQPDKHSSAQLFWEAVSSFVQQRNSSSM